MALKGYKQAPDHVRRRTEARLSTLRTKPRPVSREWLVREYVEKRRSCNDIAAEVGYDATSVWAWLRFYAIPTRRRGAESSPTSFKKGQRGTFAGKRHTPESKERIRQARLADGGVPYLRNGVHWLAGKSGADHPSWKGGHTPERQAFYATSEWKAAVVEVWARADARCERCGLPYREVRDTQKFHVHHVVSFAVPEFRAVVANLRLLCAACHRFVHSKANVTRELIEEPPCPS